MTKKEETLQKDQSEKQDDEQRLREAREHLRKLDEEADRQAAPAVAAAMSYWYAGDAEELVAWEQQGTEPAKKPDKGGN